MNHDTLTHAMQTYQSREEPERLFALAGKYWRIMLAIEILIFVAAVAGGAYLLIITLFDFNPNKTQDITTQTMNRGLLTQTLQGFDARKTLFESLRTGATPTPDPSR